MEQSLPVVPSVFGKAPFRLCPERLFLWGIRHNTLGLTGRYRRVIITIIAEPDMTGRFFWEFHLLFPEGRFMIT
jgi:hypothetical protein